MREESRAPERKKGGGRAAAERPEPRERRVVWVGDRRIKSFGPHPKGSRNGVVARMRKAEIENII